METLEPAILIKVYASSSIATEDFLKVGKRGKFKCQWCK